jgi:hypothetical protein
VRERIRGWGVVELESIDGGEVFKKRIDKG